MQFSTKPKIFGKTKYDYEAGGFSYSDRVPKNLVGESIRKTRADNDAYNEALINDRASQAGSF